MTSHPLPPSQWRASTTTVAGRVVQYHTRPGLPSGLEVSPAALWLAHECAKYADPVLSVDVAFGLPALAFPTRHNAVLTRHAGVAASIAHTAPALTIISDGNTLAPAHYQTILIEVPPTREAWRQRLCQVWPALAPGGVLIACGANDAGGKIAASDVKALFGRCNEQSKHHQRLVTAIKPAALASQPPWFAQPGIARDTWTHIESHGRRYVSQAGVFAHDRVDAGSALLCQHLPVLAGQQPDDLGRVGQALDVERDADAERGGTAEVGVQGEHGVAEQDGSERGAPGRHRPARDRAACAAARGTRNPSRVGVEL